jgi:hypothetical protein
MKEIRSDVDRQALQDALNKLQEWADKWGMSFNLKKCKIMHIGHNNPRYDYYMNGHKLVKVEEETDVGVLVHRSMKPAKQCQKAANTASGVLRTIRRNFHFRDKKVFVGLYKQYVRPHLEFSATAWAPWNEGDIKLIEGVQRAALSMIPALAGLDYTEKCTAVGLSTLEERRWEQDMVQTFKIVKGVGNMKREEFFEMVGNRSVARTRLAQSEWNLKVQRARTDIRKNSFAVRVVNSWNCLPESIKSCDNIIRFKRALKDYMRTVRGRDEISQ